MKDLNRANYSDSKDEHYMRLALELAHKGIGYTNPNPIVGAIVVKEGRIVGRGYHHQFGGPHAEVYALEQAKQDAAGATIYVTLEPCSHHGKTPPCVDRIIEAGISRAVIACRDPNPLVNGEGVRKMVEAGIKVTEGVLEAEARKANEIFFKYIRTKMPFVQLKLAESLDGRIATHAGDSKWISGIEARKEVHRLRARFSAILVGVNTVIKDDPLLTVRHVEGPNPVRIVVDGSGMMPHEASMLSCEGRTIVTTTNMSSEKEALLRERKVDVWRLAYQEDERVDLQILLSRLASEGIDSVLVEGGGETAALFLERGLVDKVSMFIAPIIIGGRDSIPAVAGEGVEKVTDALRLHRVSIRRFEDDIMIDGYLEAKA